MTGPLPRGLDVIAVPSSRLYAAAVGMRNRWYDRAERSTRVARPVISVGNVTAGGSGKTPVVTMLARLLRDAGHRPAVALRGYGAGPGDRGDEAAEYAITLPDVPLIVGPDRARAIERALAGGADVDCILLDDGFQHRRLARDLDLVLVDAARPGLDGRLLPAGWLREPASGLRRADAVLVTHADRIDDALASAIERHHGRAPLAWSRHVWRGLDLHGAGAGSGEAAWLRGRTVATLLGVGNPAPLERQIEAAGARIAVRIPARDHQAYVPGDVARIAAACGGGLEALVTTRKDWVKLARLTGIAALPVPVVVPDVAIDVFEGGEALRELVLARAADRA